MPAQRTNASAFTARIGFGGAMFGLRGFTRHAELGAILICNQGVGGSSPSGGTHFFAKTVRASVPRKSTAVPRCASVPRIASAQRHPTPAPTGAGWSLVSGWIEGDETCRRLAN